MENFDCDIFCERVSSLFGNMGQMELAQKIGIAQGVISSIKNKKVKAPGADTVLKIASAFGVSTDYLLGLSPNPTIDKEKAAVCDYVGLSQAAVECLLKEKGKKSTMTSDVLESEEFWNMIFALKSAKANAEYLTPNPRYVRESIKAKFRDDNIPELYRHALSVVGQTGLAPAYKQQISEEINALFDKVVTNENP
ncbi:MAG: helix-turn-helix transcriptional regulator [Clostridia bacterium]|nr:helix-turn-helix transcriptional regulator [Clostridia bacterium]